MQQPQPLPQESVLPVHRRVARGRARGQAAIVLVRLLLAVVGVLAASEALDLTSSDAEITRVGSSDLTSQTRPDTLPAMGDTYSTYDAKAKLSEILRKVESGRTITISRRGEPIAEVRPLRPAPISLRDRLQELAENGVLIPASAPRAVMRPLADRPGALERFLSDRGT